MRKWPISLLAIALPLGFQALGSLLVLDGGLSESEGLWFAIIVLLTFPLWIALFYLPTLGFAGIAFEVFSKRVARGWIVLPAVFFGCYFTLIGIERWEMVQVAGKIDEANAKVEIAFNPQAQSLMLADESDLSLARYDVPVIYSRGLPGLHDTLAAHYVLAQGTCHVIEEQFAGTADSRNLMVRKLIDRDGTGYPSFCLLSLEAEPSRPLLTLAPGETSEHSGIILRYHEYQTTITSPDGTHRSLRSASARPLPIIPALFPACLVTETEEKSDCAYMFSRHAIFSGIDSTPLGEDWRDWLPHALGLREVSPNQRRTTPHDIAIALVSRDIAARQARNIAKLDAVLAQMAGSHEELDPLRQDVNEQALAERMPEIMDAIEANLGEEGNRRNNALDLADFVLAQQSGPLEAHYSRFERLSEGDTRLSEYWLEHQVRRLPPEPPGPDDMIIARARR